LAFFTVLFQVVVIFILMAAGFLLFKTGILDDHSCRSMTRMLIYLVSPVIIVYSFQIKLTPELMHGLEVSALSAVGAHVAGIIITQLLFARHPADRSRRSALKYAVVYSNCGFIGIPLLTALLGTKGVFYASVYIGVFNLFTWTHGVMVFTGKPDRRALRGIVLNPNLMALAVGLMLFAFSVKIPTLLYDSMGYIFNMNTPLAMIVIGARMAQTDMRTIFTDKLVWPGVLLRNFAMPVLMLMLLHLAGVSGPLLTACLIPVCCPVGGNTVLFADLFGSEVTFATKVMTVSTLLSVLSIPAVVYLISALRF
jgi:malate permease and related proteins